MKYAELAGHGAVHARLPAAALVLVRALGVGNDVLGLGVTLPVFRLQVETAQDQADDYRVASPFATAFRFSRFDALAEGKRGPAPVVAPKSAWAPSPEAAPGVATAGNDA